MPLHKPHPTPNYETLASLHIRQLTESRVRSSPRCTSSSRPWFNFSYETVSVGLNGDRPRLIKSGPRTSATFACLATSIAYNDHHTWLCLMFAPPPIRQHLNYDVCLKVRGWLIDWVRLNVPPTHYRSYGDEFLQVRWLNQQCQSTEGTHKTLNQIEQNTTIHLN